MKSVSLYNFITYLESSLTFSFSTLVISCDSPSSRVPKLSLILMFFNKFNSLVNLNLLHLICLEKRQGMKETKRFLLYILFIFLDDEPVQFDICC